MPVAESGDPAERRSNSGPPSTSTRRRFLGTIGASAALLAGTTRAAAAREPPTVAMGDNYFDPIGLHVEPGTEVRFEIEAGSHSATAYDERIPDGAAPFDSGTISEGGFEHTFETPGTYDYYCRPHRSMGMVGRIVVDEPGGPAEATPIPDGDVPDSDAIAERGAVGVDEFDGSGGNGDGRRGPMRGGPMMNGSGPGWMVLVPVGFLTTIFGVVGGTIYWVVTRTDPE